MLWSTTCHFHTMISNRRRPRRSTKATATRCPPTGQSKQKSRRRAALRTWERESRRSRSKRRSMWWRNPPRLQSTASQVRHWRVGPLSVTACPRCCQAKPDIRHRNRSQCRMVHHHQVNQIQQRWLHHHLSYLNNNNNSHNNNSGLLVRLIRTFRTKNRKPRLPWWPPCLLQSRGIRSRAWSMSDATSLLIRELHSISPNPATTHSDLHCCILNITRSSNNNNNNIPSKWRLTLDSLPCGFRLHQVCRRRHRLSTSCTQSWPLQSFKSFSKRWPQYLAQWGLYRLQWPRASLSAYQAYQNQVRIWNLRVGCHRRRRYGQNLVTVTCSEPDIRSRHPEQRWRRWPQRLRLQRGRWPPSRPLFLFQCIYLLLQQVTKSSHCLHCHFLKYTRPNFCSCLQFND